MKILITSLAVLSSSILFAQKTAKKDSTETKKIEEVVLQKKVFQKKSDRFVYDVASSPVAKGNTTFGLLKETPLVSSTDDKTLKIAGKADAVIFIDGRKTLMDADALVAFLKNTPAENIQKIEVITLPGSEFDVASSDGIINIVLKKKMENGLNGNMRMNNAQNLNNSTGAGVSLNYRKDKLGISSNINTSQDIEPQHYLLKNGNSLIGSQSEGDFSDPNQNLGGYINADYQLNEKSNLALTYNSWANKSYNSTIDLLNTLTDFTTNTSTYNRTLNDEDARSYNNSANLNYELKTDTLGSKLVLNVAGLFYKRMQTSTNNTFNSDINKTKGDLLATIAQQQPQKINNFSAKGDYIKKYKKDLTVSIGANFNKTNTDNDTKYVANYFGDAVLDGVNTVDNPNHFLYSENIYAGYFTIEKTFSPKFSGKLGSRYEITNSEGKSDNTDNIDLRDIKRKYNKFLPYVSLNYAINENNNISYAFSSRMRRPSFWELNPTKNIFTLNNYTQNNPFVKASSVYTNELTYMFKSSYFLIANHSLTKDQITQVPLQRDIIVDGKTVRQLRYVRTNFGDKQEMSLMLGLQKSYFKKYLSVNFNIGAQHNINNGTLNQDPVSGDIFDTYVNKISSTSLLINTSSNLQLDKKKTWFLGVNYFYVDKQQIELGQLKSLMSLDASVKKLWNDWTFSIGLNDILNTNKVTVTDYQPSTGNSNYIRQNQYNRSVEFTIVYNFGNKKITKMRDLNSATDDIKGRTR